MNNGWIITVMSGYHGEELLPSQIINTFDRDKILIRIYFQPCVRALKAFLLESCVPYL